MQDRGNDRHFRLSRCELVSELVATAEEVAHISAYTAPELAASMRQQLMRRAMRLCEASICIPTGVGE